MDANPIVPAAALSEPEALERTVKSGTSWFGWIAALSLVNTGMALAGSDTSFVVGLAVTQLVDGIARAALEDGVSAAIYVAAGFDILAFGVLMAFAVSSRKHPAAYATGIALYALDALLCAAFDLWQHVAFHAFALFFLWRGFAALRKLRAAAAPVPAPAPEARPNPLVR